MEPGDDGGRVRVVERPGGSLRAGRRRIGLSGLERGLISQLPDSAILAESGQEHMYDMATTTPTGLFPGYAFAQSGPTSEPAGYLA